KFKEAWKERDEAKAKDHAEALLASMRDNADLAAAAGFPVVESSTNEFTEELQWTVTTPLEDGTTASKVYETEQEAHEAWRTWAMEQHSGNLEAVAEALARPLLDTVNFHDGPGRTAEQEAEAQATFDAWLESLPEGSHELNHPDEGFTRTLEITIQPDGSRAAYIKTVDKDGKGGAHRATKNDFRDVTVSNVNMGDGPTSSYTSPAYSLKNPPKHPGLTAQANADLLELLTQPGQLTADTRVEDRTDLDLTFDQAIKQGIATTEQLQARVAIYALEQGIPLAQAAAEVATLSIKARRFAEAARGSVYRSTVQLFRGADPKDILEDMSEDAWARAFHLGLYERSQAIEDIRALEALTGNKYLRPDLTFKNEQGINEEAGLDHLIEALSTLSLEYAFGRIQDGSLGTRLRQWLHTMVATFAGAFKHAKLLLRSRDLKAQIAAGNIDKRLLDLIADSVGLNPTAQESRFQQQAQAQIIAEAMGDFEEIGSAIKGRLPHPETLHRRNHPLAGEVERIHDSLTTTTRRRTKRGKAVRNAQKANNFFLPIGEMADIDHIREAMNEKGFDFDTPADLLAAVADSVSYNIPTYATNSATDEDFDLGQDSFSIGRAWPTGFPRVVQMSTVAKLKSSPGYTEAKAGDMHSAIAIARSLTKPAKALALSAEHPEAILVSIHGLEATGINALPSAFAKVLSSVTSLEVDEEIVMVNRPHRTGKGSAHRMASRPKFNGAVQTGRDYIIVDDVVTQGGSISELRAYIEENGGHVVAASTLAAAQFGTNLALSEKSRLALVEKFGEDALRGFAEKHSIYGGEFLALTEGEARAILRFQSLDAAGSAIATAKQEADANGNAKPFEFGQDGQGFLNFSLGAAHDMIYAAFEDVDGGGPGPQVATDPLEGGKVRSIAKLFHRAIVPRLNPTRHALGLKSTWAPGQEAKWLRDVTAGGDRLLSFLRIAREMFPEFQSWYESRVRMALAIFSEIDPAASQPANNFTLRIALAVTSNGNKVKDQTFASWNVYQDWKTTGKMGETAVPGKRGKEIQRHLQLVDKLVKKFGFEVVDEFFQRTGTVDELRRALVEDFNFTAQEAKDLTTGELIDEVVPFSLVFGAKLGSFLNNLSGNFDTVTMDRWFMRTFGRALGIQLKRIKPSAVAKKRERFKAALAEAKQTDAGKALLRAAGLRSNASASLATLKKITKHFESESNRRHLSAEANELRKAANGFFQIADGFQLQEAPAGGSQRRYIRLAMEDARAKFIEETGQDWNPAELQALLWYFEKAVHDTYGSKQKDESPDYASAANELFRHLNGGTADAGAFEPSNAVTRRSLPRRSNRQLPGQAVGGQGIQALGTLSLSERGVRSLESTIQARLSKGPEERVTFYRDIMRRMENVLLRYEDFALARNGPVDPDDLRIRLMEGAAEAEAIISALPPEIRGKVRIPVSSILDAKTERGKLKVFRDLIDQADAALEPYLVAQYRDAISTILDLARPIVGDSRRISGRLTPETQRLIAKIIEAIPLTPTQVLARTAGIEATLNDPAHNNDPDNEDHLALLDELETLDTFGALATLDAARLAGALATLKHVYAKGRGIRRFLEEAKRQERQGKIREVLDSLGLPHGPSQSQLSKRTEQDGLKELAGGVVTGHWSFHQKQIPGSTAGTEVEAHDLAFFADGDLGSPQEGFGWNGFPDFGLGKEEVANVEILGTGAGGRKD
ncbi:MAG: phosphoribosyltransferase, partial [Verrucomicrobia bacterium]|nr:phosphoribosyltransferase [Verrucomicrobiota bacterium]